MSFDEYIPENNGLSDDTCLIRAVRRSEAVVEIDILQPSMKLLTLRITPNLRGISDNLQLDEMKAGEVIDRARFRLLGKVSLLCTAIQKGVAMLEYGDNSVITLTRKLTDRGYPKSIAEKAARYLAKRGILDEDRQAEAAASMMARVKNFGPSRIKSELYQKGYRGPVIEKAMAALEDSGIDFDEICTAAVLQKMGRGFFSESHTPEHRKAVEKLYAAMARRGFTAGHVRSAIRQLESECE